MLGQNPRFEDVTEKFLNRVILLDLRFSGARESGKRSCRSMRISSGGGSSRQKQGPPLSREQYPLRLRVPSLLQFS